MYVPPEKLALVRDTMTFYAFFKTDGDKLGQARFGVLPETSFPLLRPHEQDTHLSLRQPLFAPGLRATASYATGFKAPTFNDLYYPAGPFAAGWLGVRRLLRTAPVVREPAGRFTPRRVNA
mgnify:CR=1 FL=1